MTHIREVAGKRVLNQLQLVNPEEHILQVIANLVLPQCHPIMEVLQVKEEVAAVVLTAIHAQVHSQAIPDLLLHPHLLQENTEDPAAQVLVVQVQDIHQAGLLHHHPEVILQVAEVPRVVHILHPVQVVLVQALAHAPVHQEVLEEDKQVLYLHLKLPGIKTF